MTFSQMIKEELCSSKFPCGGCAYALNFAMLYFTQANAEGYLYKSDRKEIIGLLAEKLVEDTGIIVTTVDPDIQAKQKHKRYHLVIDDTEDRRTFETRYSIPLEQFLSGGALQNECCKLSFLRGVFIACGTVVNPKKEYHFELKIPYAEDAELLAQLFAGQGFPLKRTKRKGNQILYLKESEHIEEVLTYLGALKSVFELMNIKIEKDLRNKVNRVTNCETANIQKTVTASMKQAEDIRYIYKQGKADELSDDLKQTAEIRLKYPELSLTELCEQMPVKISRSGLNHRLKKLSEIAQGLRE